MSKSEENINVSRLKDGDDSGSVPDGVRFQVFVDGLGICATPECNARGVHYRTKLSECAHIIPRKVGSHPREDYTTPLDERKKESNLLYLCEKHHKIIDNKEHSEIYTANVLREWKEIHELWAKNVTKNSPYLPEGLKSLLASLGDSISTQADVESQVLKQLLQVCRELVQRNRVEEARIFLAQIDTLMISSNDDELKSKSDLLQAKIVRISQDIPEAKKQLLNVIRAYPTFTDAMAEYVELCRAAPEPGDGAEGVEKLLRDLDSKHPQLRLHDLSVISDRGEKVTLEELPEKWTDDVSVNARFLCQYAIFFDSDGNLEARDDLIKKWEAELPTSPRPDLFRLIFKSSDIIRSETVDKNLYWNAIEFFDVKKEQLVDKDPLGIKDQLLWVFHELRLTYRYCHYSGAVGKVSSISDQVFDLLEKCYFDKFIYTILPEILGVFYLDKKKWLLLLAKLDESSVAPSNEFISLFFLQGFNNSELNDSVSSLVSKYATDEIKSIWEAYCSEDAQMMINALNDKGDIKFSLVFSKLVGERSPQIMLELCESLVVEPEDQLELRFLKLVALDQLKRGDDCIALLELFPVDEAAPHSIEQMSAIAFRYNKWDLFIPMAQKLLNAELGSRSHTQIRAQLAMACTLLGDDSRAITYAESALENAVELGSNNFQNTLRILIQSLQMKGHHDEACLKFEQYAGSARSFQILLLGADAYLKATSADRYSKSLNLVMRAFEECDAVDDKLYLGAYMILIDLTNSNVITLEQEEAVTRGCFIKIEGLANWFVVGGQAHLGATRIQDESVNYKTVIDQKLLAVIDWPSDRFKPNRAGRAITHILKPEAFLSQRAHEAVRNVAETGEEPIWSVQVIQEDGSIDRENLRRFSEDQFKQATDFFQLYVKHSLPISFLCANEGGILPAIGRINREKKGFIRCNNGSRNDIEIHARRSKNVLIGKPFFLDGLVAIMLVESDLLKKVMIACPAIIVTTSVIRLLREVAQIVESSPSSVGRGTICEW